MKWELAVHLTLLQIPDEAQRQTVRKEHAVRLLPGQQEHTHTAHSSFSFLIELYRAWKDRKQDGITLFILFDICNSSNGKSRKPWLSQPAAPRAPAGHPVGAAEMRKTRVSYRQAGSTQRYAETSHEAGNAFPSYDTQRRATFCHRKTQDQLKLHHAVCFSYPKYGHIASLLWKLQLPNCLWNARLQVLRYLRCNSYLFINGLDITVFITM